jgi:hypothetical protein
MYRSSYHLTPASNRCLVYATFSAHFFRYQFQTLFEHAVGGLPLHYPALMWPLGVVVFQVTIQACLHLLHCSGLIIPDTVLGGTVATMTRGVQ